MTNNLPTGVSHPVNAQECDDLETKWRNRVWDLESTHTACLASITPKDIPDASMQCSAQKCLPVHLARDYVRETMSKSKQVEKCHIAAQKYIRGE